MEFLLFSGFLFIFGIESRLEEALSDAWQHYRAGRESTS